MRKSGVPSLIRKRAVTCGEAADPLTLQKKQRIFVSPVPRPGAMKPLPNNGELGATISSKENASKTTVSGAGVVDKQVVLIEDDDVNAKVEKGEQKNGELLETPLSSSKEQALVRTGGSILMKRGRLAVRPVTLSFKSPAVARSVSGVSSRSNKSFNLPKLPSNSSVLSDTVKNTEIGKQAEKIISNYYCVMYCTRKLNAKHKGPWSDGILICRGRSSVLQDTDGKVITKDNSHRCGEKSEGATFPLGKFEVEIMKKSTEEEFLSGTIFTGTAEVQVDATVNLALKRGFKRTLPNANRRATFSTPAVSSASPHLRTPGSLPNHQHTSEAQKRKILKFEVKEDALILNRKELQRGAFPVVVDPYLVPKLRQHQREGVEFMYDCVMGLRNSRFTGCLLADAMGLGKTLQVIALMWTLLQQGPRGRPAVKRVLVICPSSLVENWGKEVRKWLKSERLDALLIHSGTSTKDVKRKLSIFQIGKVSPVLITSYELLRKYNEDLKSAEPELLVCDEAHRLKNCAGNKTIDALLALNCPMRILLTGTPIQNDLMEFYAMMDFANKGLLGSLSAFKRLYADPIEKSRDRDASDDEKVLGRTRSTELQYKTRLYVMQRSSDVNLKYLPQKTELVVFCKLQASQISLYQTFLKSKAVDFLSNSQSSVVLSAIGTLRKLCNHPALLQSELIKENKSPQRLCRGEDWRQSGKLNCLYTIISAVHADSNPGIKDKIVVVSNFTQTLDIIQTLCETESWKWLRLDGATGVSDRQGKVDRFNAEYNEERVFLLSSKAGGSGLNLIGANRLVLFDPDWNPATDAQAMARVWRDGQNKNVVIYRLLTTGSIEEKIYQRQLMKQEVAAAVEDHLQGQNGRGGRHFSREELRELFTLRLETHCDTYDLLSQSSVRRTERWRDYSDELEDHVLDQAIQTGVVTFVHKKVERTGLTFSYSNSSGDEVASNLEACMPGKEIGQPDKHNDSYKLQSVCVESLERSHHQPHSSNESPKVRPLHFTEDPQDNGISIHSIRSPIEACFARKIPSTILSGNEDQRNLDYEVGSMEDKDKKREDPPTDCGIPSPGLPADDDALKADFTDHEHQGVTSAEHCLEIEVDSSQDRYCTVEMLNDDGESNVVDCAGDLLKQDYPGGEATVLETISCVESSVKTGKENDPGMSLTESSMDLLCESINECSGFLGPEGHKILDQMMKFLVPTQSDVDDLEALEALDMPFLSDMELEIELKRANFTPENFWTGLKRFAFGFLLGDKQERIYYSSSTLGLVLEKCNRDNTATTESIFCKGLPLVRAALSKRYGHEEIRLVHLLNFYENKEDLLSTANGRFLVHLTRLLA